MSVLAVRIILFALLVSLRLEELRGCDVYLGSPSEIAATLYAQASSRLDTSRLLFIDDESELPVVDRLGLCL